MPSPTRPSQLSPYAEGVLRALAGAGLGQKISLGGALGLQHYCEYRVTSDLDAAAAKLRNWFGLEFFDALVA